MFIFGIPIVGIPIVGIPIVGIPIVGIPIVGIPIVGILIVGIPIVGIPIVARLSTLLTAWALRARETVDAPPISFRGVASSFLVLLLGAGLFAGLGMGGGLVYRPTLLALGWADHLAVATSCMLVTVSGTVAGLLFAKFQYADVRLAVPLGLSAATGSLVGGLTCPQLNELTLSWFGAGGLLVAVWLSLKQPSAKQPSAKSGDPGDHSATKKQAHTQDPHTATQKPPRVAMPLLVLAAIAAGFASAWIGIGGGLFIVPLLVGPFKIPPKTAIGTSAWVVIVVGLTGCVGHALGGSFAGLAALSLVPAVALGAGLGAYSATRIHAHKLRWLITAVCGAVCIMFLVRSIWLTMA